MSVIYLYFPVGPDRTSLRSQPRSKFLSIGLDVTLQGIHNGFHVRCTIPMAEVHLVHWTQPYTLKSSRERLVFYYASFQGVNYL